jgi:predicted HTH domain antitoxin
MTFPNQPDLNPERERQPDLSQDESATQDTYAAESAGEESYTLEQAAEYLGVKPDEFQALAKEYGVGRYYQSSSQEQFVYNKEDIEAVKRARS